MLTRRRTGGEESSTLTDLEGKRDAVGAGSKLCSSAQCARSRLRRSRDVLGTWHVAWIQLVGKDARTCRQLQQSSLYITAATAHQTPSPDGILTPHALFPGLDRKSCKHRPSLRQLRASRNRG
eukprot:3349375-Rhodomonas_salina.1